MTEDVILRKTSVTAHSSHKISPLKDISAINNHCQVSGIHFFAEINGFLVFMLLITDHWSWTRTVHSNHSERFSLYCTLLQNHVSLLSQCTHLCLLKVSCKKTAESTVKVPFQIGGLINSSVLYQSDFEAYK